MVPKCWALLPLLAQAATAQSGQICCYGLTASCLACQAGMTIPEYCAQNPSTGGCPATFVLPPPPPPPLTPTSPTGTGTACSSITDGDCATCLQNGCGYVQGGTCLDSCSMIADVPCFGVPGPTELSGGTEPSQVCAHAKTAEADVQACSASQGSCAECVGTTKSNGEPCRWFMDFNGCLATGGMMGPGVTSCASAPRGSPVVAAVTSTVDAASDAASADNVVPVVSVDTGVQITSDLSIDALNEPKHKVKIQAALVDSLDADVLVQNIQASALYSPLSNTADINFALYMKIAEGESASAAFTILRRQTIKMWGTLNKGQLGAALNTQLGVGVSYDPSTYVAPTGYEVQEIAWPVPGANDDDVADVNGGVLSSSEFELWMIVGAGFLFLIVGVIMFYGFKNLHRTTTRPTEGILVVANPLNQPLANIVMATAVYESGPAAAQEEDLPVAQSSSIDPTQFHRSGPSQAQSEVELVEGEEGQEEEPEEYTEVTSEEEEEEEDEDDDEPSTPKSDRLSSDTYGMV